MNVQSISPSISENLSLILVLDNYLVKHVSEDLIGNCLGHTRRTKVI